MISENEKRIALHTKATALFDKPTEKNSELELLWKFIFKIKQEKGIQYNCKTNTIKVPIIRIFNTRIFWQTAVHKIKIEEIVSANAFQCVRTYLSGTSDNKYLIKSKHKNIFFLVELRGKVHHLRNVLLTEPSSSGRFHRISSSETLLFYKKRRVENP